MFHIQCPWCGWRNQTEFSYGGEADRSYPQNSMEMDDEQWKDYLFIPQNPKGIFHEQWNHAHGCRRWFNVVRDTASNDIKASYRIGDPGPDIGDDNGPSIQEDQ